MDNTSAQPKAFEYADNGERREILANISKVVIKVGTKLLTGDRHASKAERIEQLIDAVSVLRARGLDVLLVSSGAIGAGMTVLGTHKRPRQLPYLQSYAAVGQCRLMYLYETACEKHGWHSAQILLTEADVKDRERHLNVTSCLNALLAKGVLPVINENDSVSVDEIRFGDNDTLAAMVAVMVKADLTILLTTVDGLQEIQEGNLGERLSVVREITPAVRNMAQDTADPNFSVGGMNSKVQAADSVVRAGEALWIANGEKFDIVTRLIDGEDLGTLFMPRSTTPMRGQQRYLAFFSGCNGELLIDRGAASALRNEGRSLLPKGVIGVKGNFKRGDTLRITTEDGIEVGRGISNYDAAEIKIIEGAHSKDLTSLLGYDAVDNTVVHRDRMVITGEDE
ncbi:MAG: glutamate 5-kinase, partial [Lentisphaeria bacterium]